MMVFHIRTFFLLGTGLISHTILFFFPENNQKHYKHKITRRKIPIVKVRETIKKLFY